MHTRDGHIVHQCLSGSTEAFALLVDRYKERIFALVYAKVGQFQDAEDLTQDIFLEAYKNLSTLRRWDNFYPWLYSIASNQCKNFHRAQKRQVATALLAEPDENHRIDVDAHSEKLTNERVHDALASLPEMHRQVLVLRYMTGMKSKEIAETLRVSPNAINQRLMRARAKLKTALSEEMIPMIRTTFAERNLQPGFTARVVELISEAKIQTAPHKTALPFGLSAAGGLILLLLSLSIPHSPLYPLGEWLGGYLPLNAQVAEDGELPADAEATRVAILGAEREDGNFGRRPKPPKMPAAIGYQDHQTWSLPEYAIARFAKGGISQGEGVIAFSPDGEHLAVATATGVWLYDVLTTRELALFAGGHSPWEGAVVFSPDGALLAAGHGSSIKLWEVSTRRNIATLDGQMGAVWSVAFSPDGTKLASGADTTVKLWDVATGKNISTLSGHTALPRSVAFSPDGRNIASGSIDKTIKLWDVATGKDIATFAGHTDHVESVAFSPDGTKLVSGSSDTTVKLWNVTTGKNIATLTDHPDRVSSVAFSPDGTKFASGADNGTVRLCDADTGHLITMIRAPRGGLYKSVAFSPDGALLAHTRENLGAVDLWDVSAGKVVGTITGHHARVFSLAFSPHGTKLAATVGHDEIKLWDVSTGKTLDTPTRNADWTRSDRYSKDGSILATVLYPTRIILTNVSTGEDICILAGGHTDAINSVAFSPDGTRLVSGSSDNTVKLWDVSTETSIAAFEHSDSVFSVAFSPDGMTLASASQDNTVILWDISTETNVAILEHGDWVHAVAFSPDGKPLASGADYGTVKLWEMPTGKNIATLMTGHRAWVSVLAFSPDGTKLASASGMGEVLLWNLESGDD